MHREVRPKDSTSQADQPETLRLCSESPWQARKACACAAKRLAWLNGPLRRNKPDPHETLRLCSETSLGPPADDPEFARESVRDPPGPPRDPPEISQDPPRTPPRPPGTPPGPSWDFPGPPRDLPAFPGTLPELPRTPPGTSRDPQGPPRTPSRDHPRPPGINLLGSNF